METKLSLRAGKNVAVALALSESEGKAVMCGAAIAPRSPKIAAAKMAWLAALTTYFRLSADDSALTSAIARQRKNWSRSSAKRRDFVRPRPGWR
jgi:hypothetical protein